MSIRSRDITVMGAGVAGLCVARALALRGAKVRVLEQSDAIREVGAGLQISPNGGAVLRALGIKVPGLRAEGLVLRNGADGRAVLRMDLARLRPDQDYHFVHRADLIETLKCAAEEAGVEISLNRKVLGVDLGGERPCINLDGAAEDVDLLIGADGLHSGARKTLT